LDAARAAVGIFILRFLSNSLRRCLAVTITP